jgi:hypothetical protein
MRLPELRFYGWLATSHEVLILIAPYKEIFTIQKRIRNDITMLIVRNLAIACVACRVIAVLVLAETKPRVGEVGLQ